MDPQVIQRTEFGTAGGVRVTRTAEPFDRAVLDDITQQVETRRGGVLSSGMEYPGRYSRWHIAYVDPCAEIVARGRRITARALNARGEVLLPVLGAALVRAGEPGARRRPGRRKRLIPEPAGLVAEEDRSRRPTVFSALREVIAAFAGGDPHLGLYGAFGYDLAFQFEPVAAARRPARPASVTWSCTCPTSCTCWTASARPPPCTGTSSRPAAPHGGAAPGHAPRAGAGRCGGHWRCARLADRPEPGRTRASCSGPRSGSPAVTCSRWCRATCSTAVRLARRVLRAAAAAQPGAV